MIRKKTASLFSLCGHSCGIIVTRYTLLGELGFPLWLQSASPLWPSTQNPVGLRERHCTRSRYQWPFSDLLPGPESQLAMFGGGRAARLPEDWTRGRENGVVEGTNGT